MEPSSADDIKVELFRLLRAARREESYVSLDTLAKLICENLEREEHYVLATRIITYGRKRMWRGWRLLGRGA